MKEQEEPEDNLQHGHELHRHEKYQIFLSISQRSTKLFMQHIGKFGIVITQIYTSRTGQLLARFPYHAWLANW